MSACVHVERILVVVVLILLLFLEHLFELLGELRVLFEGSFDVVEEAVSDLAESIDFNWQACHFEGGLE